MNLKTEISLLILKTIVIILFTYCAWMIGSRNLENVKNIEQICKNTNTEYVTHTNFVGNVTRIYVKGTPGYDEYRK